MRDLGKKLLEVYEHGRPQDRFDLRTRPKMDGNKSDRGLFADLPLGDIGFELRCHLAFEYLFSSKNLRRGDWKIQLEENFFGGMAPHTLQVDGFLIEFWE